MYQQWVDKADGTLGTGSWSLIVGHFDFAYSEQDIGLLTGLAALAAHAGAPFLAEAHPSLIGCPSFAQSPDPAQWATDLSLFDELRKSAVSSWIGLAAPRVLMRLPYGNRSDAVEAFEFEELGPEPEHEHFLWGNAAVACAKMIGVAFMMRGWSFTLADCHTLEDLPAYTVYFENESALKPCAEIFMNERISAEVARRGLITLMSYRNRNALTVRNFQSISDPPAALSVPWG